MRSGSASGQKRNWSEGRPESIVAIRELNCFFISDLLAIHPITHQRFYCSRRAAIGSMRAARRAGVSVAALVTANNKTVTAT